MLHNGKRYSWLVASGAAALLSGLLLGKFNYSLPWATWLAVVVFVTAGLRHYTFCVLATLLFGVQIGLWRAETFNDNLAYLALREEQSVRFVGTVSDDPVYGFRSQLTFKAQGLELDATSINGLFSISGFHNNIQRGDTVEALGKMRAGYGSRQGSMSFADITVLDRSTSWLLEFRRRFIAGVYTFFPEPQASLGLGFLFGVRSLLPEDLEEDLSKTGLTHIVAVSGYNLTILIQAMRRMLQGRSRKLSVVAASLLMLGFVAMTGSSPSIVRASIVSTMALTAWYFGRHYNGVQIILYSAALSAFINPFYLWFDIGWYLSFLAFFGVLVIAPLLRDPNGRGVIQQTIVETSCAQLMTAPLIVLIFGRTSLVAVVANAVTLPFIPVAMIGTFATGLLSFASGSLAAWSSVVGGAVLTYITTVITLFASLSWAELELSFSVMDFAVAMASIGILWLILAWRHKRKRTVLTGDLL